MKFVFHVRARSPRRKGAVEHPDVVQGSFFLGSQVGDLGLAERRRGFGRQVLSEMGGRSVGVATMGDHGGRKILVGSQSLSAQVGEHGVGSPAAQDLRSGGVDASAQKCCGTARPKAFDGQQMGRNTGGVIDSVGSVTETIGDIGVGDVSPLTLVRHEVAIEGCIGRSPVTDKVARYPCHGARRTEERIVRCTLGDELVLDTVLLVSEESANADEAGGEIHVITEGINESGVVTRVLARRSSEVERF